MSDCSLRITLINNTRFTWHCLHTHLSQANQGCCNNDDSSACPLADILAYSHHEYCLSGARVAKEDIDLRYQIYAGIEGGTFFNINIPNKYPLDRQDIQFSAENTQSHHSLLLVDYNVITEPAVYANNITISVFAQLETHHL